MPTLKQCLAIVLSAATLLTGAPAIAHWPTTRVDVEVYDRTDGRVLPIYFHGGRRYIVGKPGNEYAIRVRNASGKEVDHVVHRDAVPAGT